MPWLRLIRWSNLLIIFLTQAVAWWCLIRPLHDTAPLLLTPINFLLLTASTMLIAAAGYIINDYFDIRIDIINKPDAVILEKTIPRRMAIIVHSCMNALALLLAGIVAWQAGHLEWLFLQLACTAMLWRYSTTWKRQFMIGNVVVALMTALTIIVLMVYEPAVRAEYAASVIPGWHMSLAGPFLMHPAIVLISFAVFAFLLTWMREIIKDVEDYQGDDTEGCITMPIKWGIRKSVAFVQMLGVISLTLLAWCGLGLYRRGVPLSNPIMWWMAAAIWIPLIAWMIFAGTLRSKMQFARASRQLKLIMLTGILTLVFYAFLPATIWDANFTLPHSQ